MSQRTESDVRALMALFALLSLGFGLGWAARPVTGGTR